MQNLDLFKPIEITANKTKRSLTIRWEDQHVSAYPFSLLRAACPCAECRGGHANMSATPDPNVFEATPMDDQTTRMDGISSVGTYAISIRWQDGHNFGIYIWKFLRALCPCSECRSTLLE